MFAKKESSRKNSLIFHFSCFLSTVRWKFSGFDFFVSLKKFCPRNVFYNWFQNFNPCCLGSKSRIQSERTLFASRILALELERERVREREVTIWLSFKTKFYSSLVMISVL